MTRGDASCRFGVGSPYGTQFLKERERFNILTNS